MDNNFNEPIFITRVNNIFIKLHTAIMKGDLTDVKHFLSDEVIAKYQTIIDNLNNHNERQMYDELNVKETSIIDESETDDNYIIKVRLISRYMDYIIDKDTGKLLKGDNTRRIAKQNILEFQKKKDAKDIAIVRKCPGCGASINVNDAGVCEYCGSIYNMKDYDYILTNILTNITIQD